MENPIERLNHGLYLIGELRRDVLGNMQMPAMTKHQERGLEEADEHCEAVEEILKRLLKQLGTATEV